MLKSDQSAEHARQEQVESLRPNVYYGWVMVAISFIVFGVSRGDQFISGVLVEPLQQMFHASTAAVLFSTIVITALVSGLGSPFCGILIRRISLRHFMAFGTLSVALGYLLLAHATHLWHVAVAYGMLFAPGVLTTSLAANALVVNWFVARRGLAMGIAGAGVSVAGIVTPPLATYSIAQFGFYATCIGLALTAFIVVPFVWRFVVDAPGMIVQGRENEHRVQQTGAGIQAVKEWTIARVFKDPRFWSVMVIAAVSSGVANAMFANLMPLAQHAGVPRQWASFLVSGAGLGAAVGMVFFGKLFDTMSQRSLARLVVISLALPYVIFISNPPYVLSMISVVLLGLGLGATLLLPPALCSAVFGRSGFAISYSVLTPFMVATITSGIWLFGHAYDVTGTYAYGLTAGLVILIPLFFAANLLPRTVESEDAAVEIISLRSE